VPITQRARRWVVARLYFPVRCLVAYVLHRLHGQGPALDRSATELAFPRKWFGGPATRLSVISLYDSPQRPRLMRT